MNVIEVNHLTKDYGSGRGVFDVSFAVQKGEVFGFLGPNGAGKSTTIRHVPSIETPGVSVLDEYYWLNIGFAIFQLSDEIYYRRHHKKDSKEPEKDSDDCQNT